MTVPVRKTTIVYAVRYEVSSVCCRVQCLRKSKRVWRRQLGFTTSSKFTFSTLVPVQCLLCAVEAKHLRWGDVQILDASISLWHRQAINNACSGIVLKSDVHHNGSSILNHILVQQFWPSTPSSSGSPRDWAPLSLAQQACRNTHHQPLQPPR